MFFAIVRQKLIHFTESVPQNLSHIVTSFHIANIWVNAMNITKFRNDGISGISRSTWLRACNVYYSHFPYLPGNIRNYMRNENWDHKQCRTCTTFNSPRSDSVITESLRSVQKFHRRFLFALCKPCGRLAYTMKTSSRNKFFQIFKKGNKGDTANHHHCTSITSAKNNSRFLRLHYSEEIQFPQIIIWVPKQVCEATLRAIYFQNNGHEYSAITDLKVAYGRATWDKFINILRDRLPQRNWTPNNAVFHLSLDIVCWIQLNKVGWNNKSCTCDSPMSPTLFNVFRSFARNA